MTSTKQFKDFGNIRTRYPCTFKGHCFRGTETYSLIVFQKQGQIYDSKNEINPCHINSEHI